MYYTNGFDSFEVDWLAQNLYYTYDFEAHKNLSHKQSVLFYGTHVIQYSRNHEVVCIFRCKGSLNS